MKLGKLKNCQLRMRVVNGSPSQSRQGRCIGKDAGIGPAGQSATYTAFELVLGTIAEKVEIKITNIAKVVE